MRVEEAVGRRIRERRTALHMSGAEFGARLGGFLNCPWSRQAVSQAEAGRRSFGAAELLAIGIVLGVTVTDLLTPPPGVAEFEMPSGAVLPAPEPAPETPPRDRIQDDQELRARLLDDAASYCRLAGKLRSAASRLKG